MFFASLHFPNAVLVEVLADEVLMVVLLVVFDFKAAALTISTFVFVSKLRARKGGMICGLGYLTTLINVLFLKKSSLSSHLSLSIWMIIMTSVLVKLALDWWK